MTQDQVLLTLVDRWRAIAQACRAMAVDAAREDYRSALCVAAVNREECANELAATLAIQTPDDDEDFPRGPHHDDTGTAAGSREE